MNFPPTLSPSASALRELVLACCLALPGMALAEQPATTGPDSIEQHLQKALDYYEKGEYATAILEFQTVLELDEMPTDPHQLADAYAAAAKDYLAGERMLLSGYAMVGLGNYRENSTSAGSGETDDYFLRARVGGRMNYILSDDYALRGSLDYRFREYDDSDRRVDSDLRWNGALRRAFGDDRLDVGVRGRASYRGNGYWRQDYGVFGDYRTLIDADNAFSVGAEWRRRSYPDGPLRARSRNIAELTASWTRTFNDGRASFTLDAFGGREFATNDRPDGDSNFYGLSPTLDFTLNDDWGGFVFVWYQNDRYNLERLTTDEADDIIVLPTRNDNLYEIGGGLTWEFSENWSLNPEILWVRDQSNLLGSNYSSTEIWMTLRYDF